MRVVVDTNFLGSKGLRGYLDASKENFAVLTDYSAMESYKSDPLNSIVRNMRVVCEFPEQIIVLHGTHHACGLTGSASQIAENAIDLEQTAGFPRFCQALDRMRSGNQRVQEQILGNGKEAQAHLERMLADIENIVVGIADLTATFTQAELKALRQPDANWPSALIEKISHRIMDLAARLMRDHPAVKSFPPASEAPDHFLFRKALCAIILATRWISVGGAHLTKPDRLRNDLVDINFATFATYYDDLFTSDSRLRSVYRESKLWLDHVFERG